MGMYYILRINFEGDKKMGIQEKIKIAWYHVCIMYISKMKTKKTLFSFKCIIIIYLMLFLSCATNSKNGFSSELLGTWLYEYETPEDFLIEQAYTFNIDGSGTVETRQFGKLNLAGNIFRVSRPEDVKIYYLFPTSHSRQIDIIADGSHGRISVSIDNNNCLIISGIEINLFDQSIARYRKLSEIEVEKWVNSNGRPFSKM